MKKLLFCILILVPVVAIWAQIPTYQIDYVATIPAGEKIGELGHNTNVGHMDPTNPSGMTFDSSGNLYIVDIINTRILIFDTAFKCINSIPYFGSWLGFKLLDVLYDGTILGRDHEALIIIRNGQFDGFYGFQRGELDFINPHETIQLGEYAFNWESGKLVALPKFYNYGSYVQTPFIQEPEIRRLIADPANGLGNVVIDEKKRLIVDGKLVTRNWGQYYAYHDELYNGNYKYLSEHQGVVSSPQASLVYLSSDRNKNTYWCVGNERIIIYNEKGIQIGKFNYKSEQSITYPAVHPSGDLYFLSYAEEKKAYEILRIKKQW